MDPAELPLYERDEESVRASGWPPSRFDPPEPQTAAPEYQAD